MPRKKLTGLILLCSRIGVAVLFLTLVTNSRQNDFSDNKLHPKAESPSFKYSDAHVIIFSDAKMLSPRLAPTLSTAWKYTKETYGSLGFGTGTDEQRLFIILHDGKYPACLSFGFLTNTYHPGLNLIDCGLLEPGAWARNSSDNLEKILTHLTNLILEGAQNSFNDADTNVVGMFRMGEILLYDLYLHLQSEGLVSEGDVNTVRSKAMLKKGRGNNVFWFRDWFLPIYERHGGAGTLNNFFVQTKKSWRKNSDDASYYTKMNVEDFVQFWSLAAQADLKYLAISLKQWTQEEQRNILGKDLKHLGAAIRTKNLPKIGPPPSKWTNKQGETLSLGYRTQILSVYFQNFGYFNTYPTSFFETTLKAWDYLEKTYSPSAGSTTSKNHLYISLQSENGAGSVCASSTNEIECSFNVNRSVALDKLIFELGKIELKRIFNPKTKLGTLSRPKVSARPRKKVSDWTIASILSYDTYEALGLQTPKQWNAGEMNNSLDDNFQESMRVRDWYFKIYEKYGRSAVLRKFISILSENQDAELNMGELVHFWSGAAGENLWAWAEQEFNWSDENRLELGKARRDYADLTYAGFQNQSTDQIDLPYFLIQHSNYQYLRKIQGDDHLTVYQSLDISSSLPVSVSKTKMDFRSGLSPMSTRWQYLKNTFPCALLNVDPHLRIVLRHKDTKACNYMSSLPILTELGHLDLINVIDCDIDIETPQDILQEIASIILSQTVDLYQKGGSGSIFELGALTPALSTSTSAVLNIAVFDIWIREGSFKDARKWLDEAVLQEKVETSESQSYELENWFLPIYTNYGGVSVMDEFICIINEHQDFFMNNNIQLVYTENETYITNVVNLVHLWSGAARENLKGLAAKTIGWNEAIQVSFNKARKTLLPLNYDYECILCKGLPQSRSDSPPSEQETVKISVSLIIIMALASILVIVLLVFGAKMIIYRKRIQHLREQVRNLTNQEVDEFYKGNPSLSKNNSPFHALPFNSDFEIPKERLIIENKILGSGQFGLVKVGFLKGGLEDGTRDLKVAVKMVKSDVEVEYFKAVLSEIKIMTHLGNHPNIVSLVGVVTLNIREREVFIALEFCARGDLLQYLKTHSDTFQNLFTQNVAQNSDSKLEKGEISTGDLLEWSAQIANGMAHLDSKAVIHGDLAARNVLLTNNYVAKIGDFGLSRQLINYSNYQKKSVTPLPWRWLAIESLNNMTFSSYSDIWSFGVTLWEIFTLGKLPYPGRNWNHEFVDEIIAGMRLPTPDFGNHEIYILMLDCMKNVPKERIGFLEIQSKLVKMKDRLVGHRTMNQMELESGRENSSSVSV